MDINDASARHLSLFRSGDGWEQALAAGTRPARRSGHVAGYDAMILSQTVALACESHGLGICYMGTTLFSMRAIADCR